MLFFLIYAQMKWIILLLVSCIMTIDKIVMPLNISIENKRTLQMLAFWAFTAVK